MGRLAVAEGGNVAAFYGSPQAGMATPTTSQSASPEITTAAFINPVSLFFSLPGITSEEHENTKLHYSEQRHKNACIYPAKTLKPSQHPVDKRVASGQLCELGNILQQKFLNAF